MPRIFTILNFRVSIDSSSRKNDTKTTTKFCLHLGWKKQKLEKTKSKNKRGRISCISSFFHDEKNKNLKKMKSQKFINENQWKSMKINENQWKSMKMSSCCWGSEGVWGGYPPPAIAGRTCCWGSGGGTPPDQLLADAAVGVRGGVPPLNQELPGAWNTIRFNQGPNRKFH